MFNLFIEYIYDVIIFDIKFVCVDYFYKKYVSDLGITKWASNSELD